MSFTTGIEIGEALSLEDLASKHSLESTSGVYRPLKSFLMRLPDMYLFPARKKTHDCIGSMEKKGVLYVAIGTNGTPFGKDDTATGIVSSR